MNAPEKYASIVALDCGEWEKGRGFIDKSSNKVYNSHLAFIKAMDRW